MDEIEAYLDKIAQTFTTDYKSFFVEAVPFNHWKKDTWWTVRLKTSFGYYYIETEALTAEEATQNASKAYFGGQNEYE